MHPEPPTAEDRRRALAGLVRSLDHTDLRHAMRQITEVAARSLGVARASLWLFDDGQTLIRCADLFEGATGAHTDGTELTAAAYPSYFEALRSERVIAAHDAARDPRTREFAESYLGPLRITAMLDVPIWLGGAMVGVACHEHVGDGPRRWTGDEQAFAGSIGDLTALAIEACERHRAQEALREREARLREAQQMEALGQLAAGVAHDFNNLLTIVLACSDDLMAEVGPGSPGRNAVERIHASAERASALTQRLLAFGRRPEARRDVIDLGRLLEDMVPLLSRIVGEEVGVGAEIGPGPVTALADRDQLEQILLNLALNARDAMPEGGRLLLRAALGGGEERRVVTLSVRDTGLGMSPEVLDRVFEPFYTTKPPGRGSGLGLSMVKSIVTELGGRVAARSAPGEGSTFEIELPWADPAVGIDAPSFSDEIGP